jgi:hypothetical protein
MGFAERLAELKNHSKGLSTNRQNRQNPPSVSFVTSDRGASEIFLTVLDADGYPAGLCQNCGGGNFQDAQGWRCSRCYPPEMPPKRTFTIPGGSKTQGELQDVESALRRAVAGTPITIEGLRSALSDADMDDVRHGRITVRNLRAFVATLDAEPDGRASSVQCVNCAHFQRQDGHPHLGRCSAGMPPYGAAGLWDTDRRHCISFSAASTE